METATHELKCSKSFWNFLEESDNRIARFILRANEYSYWSSSRWRAKLMLKYPLELNYLTLRGDGTISYLPKGKQHIVNEDGTWSRDNRQNGAPGRVIRKLLTPNALKLFKDSEFESLVNAYKAECDRENKTFEIWDNTRIAEAYAHTKEMGNSSLNKSCMNGEKVSDKLLDIYKYCPHVRIVVMLNGCGELAGRALLWNVDKDTIFMDRIYVSQDHYYDLFLDYAKSNGWMRKVTYNDWDEKDYFVLPDGTRTRRVITIHTNTDMSYYPYIDTFSYGGEGFITNDRDADNVEYEYNCTSGDRSHLNRQYCEINGEYYDEDDMRYIDRGRYAGYTIHMDNTVYCETDGNNYFDGEVGNILFEYNGNYYRTDDDDFVEIDGEMVHNDDAAYCDLTDEYYLECDCVYSEHHGTYILKSEAYEVDGNYFHESVVRRAC